MRINFKVSFLIIQISVIHIDKTSQCTDANIFMNIKTAYLRVFNNRKQQYKLHFRTVVHENRRSFYRVGISSVTLPELQGVACVQNRVVMRSLCGRKLPFLQNGQFHMSYLCEIIVLCIPLIIDRASVTSYKQIKECKIGFSRFVFL